LVMFASPWKSSAGTTLFRIDRKTRPSVETCQDWPSTQREVVCRGPGARASPSPPMGKARVPRLHAEGKRGVGAAC
jgi:hypothetical protein